MSNYTYVSNFGAKDALASGNANKVIKGADFETEFTEISTAIATKADSASPTFTGTVTIPTAAVTTFSLGGTTVTATAAELNLLDGVTANVQSQINDRARLSGANFTGAVDVDAALSAQSVTFGDSNTFRVTSIGKVTADNYISATEFRIGADTVIDTSKNADFASLSLNGTAVTATATELNALDGVTSLPPVYTEGTFTPSLRDSISPTGGTAATGNFDGRYTRIGRMVHVQIRCRSISTTGMTPNTSLIIHGLPFTASEDVDSQISYWIGSALYSDIADSATGEPWMPYVEDNTNYMRLAANRDASSLDGLRVDDLETGVSHLYITLWYEVA